MRALSRVTEELYWTDPGVIRVWARYATENKAWIERMGGKGFKLYRHGGEHKVPGYESIDSYRLPGMGPGLMRLLYKQVKARNIQVIHGMAATELLVDSKGQVSGVRAQTKGEGGTQKVNVRARRATILTTGGFEFDEQMKLQYLKVYPTYFTGSPANTGDGIRMALAVGAQLWHMNCVSGRFVMKFREVGSAIAPALGGSRWISPGGTAVPGLGGTGWVAEHASRGDALAGYVLVDRYGRRFTNENFKGHSLYYDLTVFDSQRLFYPRVPSYWIFDQRRMDNGPLAWQLSGPAGPARLYSWSKDNRVELEPGWIKRGETVEHLALQIGLEPQNLKDTVTRFNLGCRNGKDTEFNRQTDTLIALDSPPFYAVELWPGGPNTQGGPRRNGKAQVLRPDDSAIPRLYSAGELGSIFGMLYPGGGGNLSECVAFGRIAGENASQERPL
jgi:succinate dehydrogenase/fumarate reductase flavoprotein subunit